MKAKADIEHTHSRFENLDIGDDAYAAYSLVTAGKVRIGTTVATNNDMLIVYGKLRSTVMLLWRKNRLLVQSWHVTLY